MAKKSKNKNRDKDKFDRLKRERAQTEHAEDLGIEQVPRKIEEQPKDEPQAFKRVRPANCRFNESALDKIDKFGLLPLALFALASITASFFNIYEWGQNKLNVLFMSLGALSLAIYELIVLGYARGCRCAACNARLRSSIILFFIGIAGFIAGMTVFIIHSTQAPV